jgi:CheY-like chemotaxis protein
VQVLIVDDVAELRRLLKVILEGQGGITVLEAGSGEEALEVLDRETVDLVVMDHSMPGMSGVECVRASLAAHPHVEVVAFTSMPDAAVSFLTAGASRHFTKPEVDPLLEFIQERAGAAGAGRYRSGQ